MINFECKKIKTFLMVALCVATVLWSCKKDEQVTPEVVADFTFESGAEGAVTFKNTSKNATSYAWDFGDGNKSTEESPTHTYTKDSTYTVKFTATNAGGSDEETKTIIIKLKGTVTETQLIANFTYELGTEGAVTFKNTSENATSYAWDFGDGNKSTRESPTHTYTENGDFDVKLTATNAGGSADKTATVTISLLKGTSTQLIANFTFEVDPETAGKVTFKNTSKNATSYTWDFGDGSNAIDKNPTHTYAKNGTYTVKLTATNAGGSADTTQTVIIDNAVIKASITIDIADLSQLAILENRPKGTLIGEIVATVANTDETPVYSITSQNPAGAVGIEGNKMVVNDPSAFDYDVNTEITGEIQGKIGSVTATAAFTISIEEVVNIPDTKFKAALVNDPAINTNGDQEISVAEAQAYKGGINANGSNITDATGIEHFINITSLDLVSNALTTLNVSQNTALTALNVSFNRLTALDVSQNTALTALNLNDNKLTALDISQNTALTTLFVNKNKLSDIDVSQNKVLTQLFLNGNQLTAIDVSQNTALTTLYADNNQLTAIDVSKLAALTNLNLGSNQLTAIDVSQNTALAQLLLDSNDLTKVNLANGNNNKITSLSLFYNPNLTCVQVDDPSNIPAAWNGTYDKEKVTFQTEECK